MATSCTCMRGEVSLRRCEVRPVYACPVSTMLFVGLSHAVHCSCSVQVERRRSAEASGRVAEEDPRTIADDRGNYAIMHAISRGNNSMAILLDAYALCSLMRDATSMIVEPCKFYPK